MRLYNLFEDANQDKDYRKQALSVYTRFMAELKQHGFKYGLQKPTPEGPAYIFSFDDIRIILRPPIPSMPDVIGGYSDGKLFLFMDDVETPPLWERPKLRSLFVHELIHHYDNARADFPNNSADEKDKTGYYNHTSELNAYYQEGVDEIDAFIEEYKDHDNFPKLVDMFFSTPEKFMKFAMGRINSEFMSYLTPENQKRIKKRLYQYYMDIVKPEIDK